MYWLTLTYSDEFLPRNDDYLGVFDKLHCRNLFESLRKKYRNKCKFKHFLVSEYGTQTFRPHYHCMLFVYLIVDSNIKQRFELRKSILSDIKEIWYYGFAYNKDWHSGVFQYLTKYCCKPELIGFSAPMPTFTLISPGIGLSYLNELDCEYRQENLDFTCMFNGKKMTLPRYYQDKIAPSRVPGLFTKDREKFDLLSPEEQQRRINNNRAKAARNKILDEVQTEKKNREIAEYARSHGGSTSAYYSYQLSIAEQAQTAYARKQEIRTKKSY